LFENRTGVQGANSGKSAKSAKGAKSAKSAKNMPVSAVTTIGKVVPGANFLSEVPIGRCDKKERKDIWERSDGDASLASDIVLTVSLGQKAVSCQSKELSCPNQISSVQTVRDMVREVLWLKIWAFCLHLTRYIFRIATLLHCRIGVLQYWRIAVLPYWRIAVSPFCRITVAAWPVRCKAQAEHSDSGSSQGRAKRSAPNCLHRCFAVSRPAPGRSVGFKLADGLWRCVVLMRLVYA
jgi:hypothetical protein